MSLEYNSLRLLDNYLIPLLDRFLLLSHLHFLSIVAPVNLIQSHQKHLLRNPL